MNTVATNIRFPKDDYEDVKLLAYSQGQSVAAVIRNAVNLYKKQKLTTKAKISLVEKFKRDAVKIDVSAFDLVRDGRRFEKQAQENKILTF